MATAQNATNAKPSRAQNGAPETKSNASLTRVVQHQLAELPFYSAFDYITFTLEGRRVTLMGQVLRPSLRKYAVSAIQSLEEVESVVDQIEVLPESMEDNELRRAIYRAVYEDPTLEVYAVQPVPPIHIIVRSGGVALEGTVRSVSDKNLAGTRAGRVPNAGTIKNNLRVAAPSDRTLE